jgi:hypothetical protein
MAGEANFFRGGSFAAGVLLWSSFPLVSTSDNAVGNAALLASS